MVRLNYRCLRFSLQRNSDVKHSARSYGCVGSAFPQGDELHSLCFPLTTVPYECGCFQLACLTEQANCLDCPLGIYYTTSTSCFLSEGHEGLTPTESQQFNRRLRPLLSHARPEIPYCFDREGPRLATALFGIESEQPTSGTIVNRAI
jgi:hypothetical protein